MTLSKTSVWREIKRLILLVAGALLMAFNINTFIHAGGLIPGGFTGLTLLIQEISLRYLHVHIPFSIVFYVLNTVPAIVCFLHIGKRFTLYSVLVVIICGFMTDLMPKMFIEFIKLHDTLLSAVFGGILNASAISLCLFADATSGGSDFIAIFISEKYRKDAWNYLFIGNCVILVIAACLFTLDKALYSIIFQFTTTVGLNSFYRAYQLKTLIAVTTRPKEVFAVINARTHHGATAVSGTGMIHMEERILVYSVVYSDEVESLIRSIHAIDPAAFINVIKTEQIDGRFFRKPRD